MNPPRAAQKTVTFIDNYCEAYKDLFPEVRSFEYFKYLHLGMISELKRKTLPAIAKAVNLDNAQALHHFLSESPWSAEELKQRRIKVLLKALDGAKFTLVIDETGDKKKGKTTDYVARQYIGNLGKVENGIVSVNAYGVLGNLTFPLIFKVFKPKSRLAEGDIYKTKIELAIDIIKEIIELGFNFDVVLADSFYGESSEFRHRLEELKKFYVVALRANHGISRAAGDSITMTKWKKFDRVFSDGEVEVRYIREVIFGDSNGLRYWEITTDPERMPPNSTWFIMTNLEGEIDKTVANTYGLRTWIEYGFKQAKNELGWADYRVTDYGEIEKWWEIVMSAYLMVSLQSEFFLDMKKAPQNLRSYYYLRRYKKHPWWNKEQGWKNILNNLRLIIQPIIFYALISPWLKVFRISYLEDGFSILIALMNFYKPYFGGY